MLRQRRERGGGAPNGRGRRGRRRFGRGVVQRGGKPEREETGKRQEGKQLKIEGKW